MKRFVIDENNEVDHAGPEESADDYVAVENLEGDQEIYLGAAYELSQGGLLSIFGSGQDESAVSYGVGGWRSVQGKRVS